MLDHGSGCIKDMQAAGSRHAWNSPGSDTGFITAGYPHEPKPAGPPLFCGHSAFDDVDDAQRSILGRRHHGYEGVDVLVLLAGGTRERIVDAYAAAGATGRAHESGQSCGQSVSQ